jgi:hypothetical protein
MCTRLGLGQRDDAERTDLLISLHEMLESCCTTYCRSKANDMAFGASVELAIREGWQVASPGSRRVVLKCSPRYRTFFRCVDNKP